MAGGKFIVGELLLQGGRRRGRPPSPSWRSDIRFAGRVHERPVVPFVESSLALAGALEHRLDGERVRERTRIYEAMSAGAGRPEDEALLLAPFDPIAVR